MLETKEFKFNFHANNLITIDNTSNTGFKQMTSVLLTKTTNTHHVNPRVVKGKDRHRANHLIKEQVKGSLCYTK